MTSGESYVMDDIVVAAEDSEVANIEHGEFELAVGGGYNQIRDLNEARSVLRALAILRTIPDSTIDELIP